MKLRNGEVIRQICDAMWDLLPGKLPKEARAELIIPENTDTDL